MDFIKTMFRINRVYATAFLIALITLLVYLSALQNGFVSWDDDVYVYENLNIRTIDCNLFKWVFSIKANPTWHPLTLLSLALDYSFWELNPLGYHLTNIVLHAVNTFLVFTLAYRLISLRACQFTAHGSRLTLLSALITALLFGIHPVHVESVAWVSERKDVLCAFFFLLSILAYIKYAGFTKLSTPNARRPTPYALSLFFFILALMSKPMAVSLPLVLLILDYYPFGRFETEGVTRLLVEKIPFFVLIVISSIITILAQDVGGALVAVEKIPLMTRVLVALRAYVFYLGKMIMPHNLAPYYPYPENVSIFSSEFTGSLVIMSVVTAVALRSFRKNPFFCAAWFYYLFTLLPVIGIIKVGVFAAADRYTYLPSLGPFLLSGVALGVLYETASNKYRIAIMAALLLSAGLLINKTIDQTGLWRDSITFWSYEIKLYPEGSPLPYYNRGSAYALSGNYAQAVNDLNKAIELDPGYAEAYTNRGIVYDKKGEYDRAIAEFSRAIALNPSDPVKYNNRGIVYNEKGEYDRAIADFNRAISLNPSDPMNAKIFNNLGLIYLKLGRVKEAEREYKNALKENPSYIQARMNLGNLYYSRGLLDEAIKEYREAARHRPDFADAHYNLGLAYRDKGLKDEARRAFENVLKLNQDGVDARRALESL